MFNCYAFILMHGILFFLIIYFTLLCHRYNYIVEACFLKMDDIIDEQNNKNNYSHQFTKRALRRSTTHAKQKK